MTQPAEQRLQRAAIALGSNIGDRLATLEQACDLLSDTFGALRLSQVYETEPVGCPPGSPSYLNACVEVETTLSPEQILQRCLAIENELGRKRSGIYGEPRTCDLDLIYVGTELRNTPQLTLPHPRAYERPFVLYPLRDIDPMLTLPGQNLTVSELIDRLPADGPQISPFPL